MNPNETPSYRDFGHHSKRIKIEHTMERAMETQDFKFDFSTQNDFRSSPGSIEYRETAGDRGQKELMARLGDFASHRAVLSSSRFALPAATGTANDFESQVGKLTDKLQRIVKEQAAEIAALKVANQDLAQQLRVISNSRRTLDKVRRAKTKRMAYKREMTKAKGACLEAARAFDEAMMEMDSDEEISDSVS